MIVTDQPPTFTPVDPALLRAFGIHRAVTLDPARAVYANRNLDLSKVKLVGFDMDYTLAIYRKLPMEQLQYEMTARRLVERLGYPAEILALRYDPAFILRGLTVDKRYGHVLKTDTYGRVGRCIHGHRALAGAAVESVYRNAKIRLQADEFASVDTLFALPEVCLYANLVDFFEGRLARGEQLAPLALPDGPPSENSPSRDAGPFQTWKLFDDVRSAIDGIHRDGSLKSVIMRNLDTYIEDDEGLALTLHKLRSAGKRLFLLTNSYWQYTDALMSHLLDGKLREYAGWRSYFDIVLVGGRKPAFFTEREPFLELDVSVGVEASAQAEPGEPERAGVTPDTSASPSSRPGPAHVDSAGRGVVDTTSASFGEASLPGTAAAAAARRGEDLRQAHTGFGGDSDTARIVGPTTSDRFDRGVVYQGGNIEAFERMAQCAGEEILYVGDHIFGDILRSKKDSRWRTMLIVEELESEITNHVRMGPDIAALSALDAERHRLDEEIGDQRALLTHLDVAAAEAESRGHDPEELGRLQEGIKRLRREIDQAKRTLRLLDAESDQRQDAIDAAFNHAWGRLLKEGNELSRFGGQVAYYADVYTSRVSNFLHYSPVHIFRAPREWMSHDRRLIDTELWSARPVDVVPRADTEPPRDGAQDLPGTGRARGSLNRAPKDARRLATPGTTR